MCFIRIDPRSAPLNPPGAAPTLTTIYADGNIPSEFASSATTSPSDSMSKNGPVEKQKKSFERKKRLGLPKGVVAAPAPAHTGVEGTEGEKRRVQEIADSLDLGAGLGFGMEETGEEAGGGGEGREKSTSVPWAKPERVVGRRAEKSVEKGERRRATLQDPGRMPVGKRRSVG